MSQLLTFSPEGDPETGPGFIVTNQDTSRENFFLIENSCDTHPWKYHHVSLLLFKMSLWQNFGLESY